jgi:Kef-type K+ transport system membrane component KefB
MTNYIILALCIVVILSYIFDISGRYSKIPGVVFLILLGIGLQLSVKTFHLVIPDLKPVLPVIGTLGLIMIVMEASLDLKLEKRKKGLISKSISSAFILFAVFSAALTYILTEFFGYSLRDSLLNAIPLGIISSSVAIPSAAHLKPEQREFIIYESSFSDIFGIIIFDFILISQGSIGHGILDMGLKSIITIVIAMVTTSILAILLHKITYHINYVIIMTSVVLVYILAKLSHLPALLLVLIFGLVLSNSQLLENTPIKKYVDFIKFRSDIKSFKIILTELTFLVRSFFFIMFGFYTKIEGLFNWQNLITGASVTAGIFLLRLLFFNQVIRMKLIPLAFFSPRGLITILLFLSIPAASRILLINEEVITLIILFSIFLLMTGILLSGRDRPPAEKKATDLDNAGVH